LTFLYDPVSITNRPGESAAARPRSGLKIKKGAIAIKAKEPERSLGGIFVSAQRIAVKFRAMATQTEPGHPIGAKNVWYCRGADRRYDGRACSG
jgi:hypothetical protein